MIYNLCFPVFNLIYPQSFPVSGSVPVLVKQGIQVSQSLEKEKYQCHVFVEFRIYIFFRSGSLFLSCFPGFFEILVFSGRNIH